MSPSNPALTYRTEGKTIVITAGEGISQASATLEWAFGAGAQGITPVGKLDGQYFEHRFSYFPKSKRLDVTFGHPAQPRGRVATLGVLQSGAVATRCFRCHATGVEDAGYGPDLTSMIPGVSCERCHGPGRAHITAAKMSPGSELVRKALLNPGRLPPKAQIQVCGECHRLPPPGSSSPEPEIEDPVTVRFAPIGLMASRCFARSGKLTCTSCHDPHRDALSRDASSYSQVCLSCHNGAAKASGKCQRGARSNCLPCHMKQVQLTRNLAFTDHRIRVY